MAPVKSAWIHSALQARGLRGRWEASRGYDGGWASSTAPSRPGLARQGSVTGVGQ
ncbi:unnamed protein product [Ectocarpus sp. 4 AP-2014]